MARTSNRVLGANDRINIGVIGCGGRGRYDADAFAASARRTKIAASCRRLRCLREAQEEVAEKLKVKGTRIIAKC